ncbi:hypothetical protein BVC80_1819g46 [Macleaya cordata]|uniref:Uncharacterized protein n=1 Tax=Macleaya cordata TaxID=56857 RepID=A0A200QW82_MACCD|nr:hypothetical protein BVC80_1819g46 [Macleaya cordata]
MAAVEARVAWQRTANRYFVQEDAKRAPKLACCPSSSASKPQVDAEFEDVPNVSDRPAVGFMPLGWNLSNSNLSPDTKWWLQLQPNIGYQKDFPFEQLNALEAELEFLRVEEVNKTSKLSDNLEEDSTHYHTNRSSGSSLDPQRRATAPCVKLETKATMQGLKILNSSNTECSLKHNNREYWYDDEELIELNCVGQLTSEQYEKCYFASASPWVGGEKTEPWWRTADKDELAFLVAQKSLEHIENCDLPPVQTRKVRRGAFACSHSFCEDGTFTLPLDQKGDVGLCNWTAYTRDSPICGSIDEKQQAAGEKWHSLYDSEKPFRYCFGLTISL